MYLHDYDEHLHNCILQMLTGKDKAEYRYNFEKYFSVYSYGEVDYRPIETKREITNECINYMEHLLELLSGYEEFNSFLLGRLSDEIEFLKLNVVDNEYSTPDEIVTPTNNKDDGNLLKEIFGESLEDFLKLAKRQKNGSQVAYIVNSFVEAGKIEYSELLFEPLRESLFNEGIITIQKSTWNGAIKTRTKTGLKSV